MKKQNSVYGAADVCRRIFETPMKEIITVIIISVLISTLVTEVRCQLHFRAITTMVDETLTTMRKIVDECMESIRKKFES